MKNKKLPFILALFSLSFLASCGDTSVVLNDSISLETSITQSSDNTADKNDGSGINQTIYEGTPVTEEFSIATTDGSYEQNGSIYTITSYGTYTLSGYLNGQIYINVEETEDGESTVELDLNNVVITYEQNSPIFAASCDELKIKALKNTYNVITDTRAIKTSDLEDQGEGAIYSKADLKLVGKGILVVNGSYNNGVHTSDDLKIKNISLLSSAPNNALKGSDSITITSGNITAISTNGDGLKTSNSSVSSKGNQKGSIELSGGNITVYSAYDGVDAAYNFNIFNGVDEDDSTITTIPSLTIYTNKYSTYSSSITKASRPGGHGGWDDGPGNWGGGGGMQDENSDKSSDSAKGIKAANNIYITGGSTYIKAYDDGIHANFGETLENGSSSTGDLIITGGNTTIYASDDGLHADRYLRIMDGITTVEYSYEGFEGNQIYISGGTNYAYATNDAINAGDNENTAGLSATINVSGGYTFTAVSLSGDTDCIDSNGTYLQSGGIVIACGPSSNNSSALDSDGSVTLSGGSLIIFGSMEKTPSYSGLTKSSITGTYSNKAYTVTYKNNEVIETMTLPNNSYRNFLSYSVNGSVTSVS